MLHHITWHQYFITTFIIAIMYYLWIILRCYGPELQKLAARLKPKSSETPDTLQYQGPEPETQPLSHPAESFPMQRENHQPTEQYPEDTTVITSQLKAVIQSASGKTYAPAALISQLKKILQSFPDIAASPCREAINELVVQECEKTGTALLTEDEVDQWWRA